MSIKEALDRQKAAGDELAIADQSYIEAQKRKNKAWREYKAACRAIYELQCGDASAK